MGVAALGMMAAGAGLNTVNAYYGARTQKLALEGQAVADEFNAKISKMAGDAAQQAGQQQIAQVTRRAGQVKAAQRTAMAANGVVVGKGSSAEVLASTDILKDQDVQAIRTNTLRSAWGYEVEWMNYQNRAAGARAQAGAISPVAAAGGALLTGGSQVASNWYFLNKEGAFG